MPRTTAPRTTACVPLLAVTALAVGSLGLSAHATTTAARPSLTQITPGNVSRLRGAWLDHIEGRATDRVQEGTPVAVGGRLYLQTGQGDVFAINGATGQVIWEYKSGFPGIERGVAVAGGQVFAALGGEHVVALSQQTGTQNWITQVGTPGQDTAANGSSTPWTMYADGLVFTGTENGGASGMRGHLYALHASDGRPAWNFAGTAGPGQPGHGTWTGNSWQLGGGDVWMAPSFDAKLGLLYLAVANPEPRVSGAARAGDNLYTNSLVALNVRTGKLAWHFQSVHHDLWDYDNTMTPVIASVRYPGSRSARTVVVYGSKSAWLYYLDAKTGKPALRVREVRVPQLPSQATARTQPIPAGQPLTPTCPRRTGPTRPIPDYVRGCEFTPYLHTPVLVAPGGAGGANWAPMSYDRKTGLLYVPGAEVDFAYSDGLPYGQPTFYKPEGEFRGGVLDAVNPKTNKIVWQKTAPFGLTNGDGVLTTSTGLLFEGSPQGTFSARDASGGRSLWTWQTGSGIETTPVTYLVNGVQYVAILAGGNTAYTQVNGDSLWAFRLGGKLGQATAGPAIPARQPVAGVTVDGSSVFETVVLGRTWDTSTNAPSTTENLASQTAMAPEIMTVPVNTTVTFSNPAGNSKRHCAEAFFDPEFFKIGPLAPGQSGTFRFTKKGTYFYNDCAGFPWNTGEIIVN
ncbi:MAG TPA: PQQ-binding-like beta-propeller repeat protein [Streptosporangiaceae bacterium]|nr:PQQ-binding-like beta-propeller repeat protein [Streptosporangiaceae bacterium]